MSLWYRLCNKSALAKPVWDNFVNKNF
jgi:hypothetical protein